jgi:hypothetical protein
VKGWLSSKLGGSKSDHKHEGQTLGGGHDSSSGAKTGEGIDDYGVAIEPTTDSGEPVRSVNDGPAHTFHTAPMREGGDVGYVAGTDILESQRP